MRPRLPAPGMGDLITPPVAVPQQVLRIVLLLPSLQTDPSAHWNLPMGLGDASDAAVGRALSRPRTFECMRSWATERAGAAKRGADPASELSRRPKLDAQQGPKPGGGALLGRTSTTREAGERPSMQRARARRRWRGPLHKCIRSIEGAPRG